MNTDQWTITPLTGTFGAELSGGRLADGINGPWLAEQLTTHLVIVLRGQHPTHAQQVELARALGEPTPAHPVVPGHPDHPEILVIDGALGGKNARWHTDVTFMPTPPAASVLVSDAVPRMRRVTIRGGKPAGPTGVESRIADDPLVAVR